MTIYKEIGKEKLKRLELKFAELFMCLYEQYPKIFKRFVENKERAIKIMDKAYAPQILMIFDIVKEEDYDRQI